MSTAEIRLTNSYWEMLRFLNDEVKLRLANMLTTSVIEGKNTAKTTEKCLTDRMIAKYAGALADDRTADEINANIMSNRSSKSIQEFTL